MSLQLDVLINSLTILLLDHGELLDVELEVFDAGGHGVELVVFLSQVEVLLLHLGEEDVVFGVEGLDLLYKLKLLPSSAGLLISARTPFRSRSSTRSFSH